MICVYRHNHKMGKLRDFVCQMAWNVGWGILFLVLLAIVGGTVFMTSFVALYTILDAGFSDGLTPSEDELNTELFFHQTLGALVVVSLLTLAVAASSAREFILLVVGFLAIALGLLMVEVTFFTVVLSTTGFVDIRPKYQAMCVAVSVVTCVIGALACTCWLGWCCAHAWLDFKSEDSVDSDDSDALIETNKV